MNIIWESIILTLTGIIVLKMTGSTSVSQMTRAEIIIVVSIGRIIVEPVLSRKVVPSIFAAIIFSGILLIIHFFELKSRKVEQFLNGSSIVIVENGKIVKANLIRAKMSEQQLYMQLREKGIHDVKRLQQVTAEPNGRIGYQLIKQAQPITLEMLEKVLDQLQYKKIIFHEKQPILQ
ncbi:YetF domain-containing protein [Bacillus toyonensis]